MRACNRACNEGMQLGDWATAQARAAPNHFRYTAAAITLRDTIHRYRCDAGPMAWIMRDAPPPAGPTLLSSSGGTLEVDGRHADAAALDILQALHAADDTGDDLILG